MRHNNQTFAVKTSSFVGPELRVEPGSNEVLDLTGPSPLLIEVGGHRATSNRVGRLFDIVGAGMLLVLCSPLFVLISAALLLGSPGPVLFRQERVGLAGRRFQVLKFRTMRVDAEEVLTDLLATDPQARLEWMRSHKLENDPRVHRLGRFLRKASLDELPQLFNVLVGSMSLVGPRPIVEEEVQRYGSRFRLAFSVKPGLTGPWQVAGRQMITYPDRVEMDARYAAEKSVSKDVVLCLRTVPAVLMGKGAS